MRSEQHGVPAGKRADEIAHGDDLMRVEPAGWLIEHQDFRVAEQRLRDRHALAKPAGQLSARHRHDALEIEPFGRRRDRAIRRFPAQSLDARHEVQKLGDAHVVVERCVLGHITDFAAQSDRVGHHVVAGNFHAPGARREIAGENAEDRALARAVGPEQADDLARFYGEGNVGNGTARPVPFAHMLGPHDRGHGDALTLLHALAHRPGRRSRPGLRDLGPDDHL